MAVVVEATLDHYRMWAELNTRHVVVVFSEAARALVAQLLVNGVIESPKTQAIIQALPADQSIDPAEVAAAVAYLAGRSPPRPKSRAAPHSCRQLARFLVITGRTGPVNGIPELTGRGARHHYDHGDPGLPCWGYEA
ncbi:Rossmann-fold NAD(P)-binding domain-containing protein [Streptomyces cellulosae]|uniref:Uncharacterized protein n=1 Tax=Streptomyces cellulosae TaxID=1968 RepID=A0ABW7YFY4_STRCE